MTKAVLEHVNITVSDLDGMADRLCKLFDWEIRWQGPALKTGKSIHVGTDDCYLALFSFGSADDPTSDSYKTRGALNHVAVVVDDLDDTEKRVLDMGFKTSNHADYEPGRRFYFDDSSGVEFEVVSYS